jgi:hypothetical protein
MGEAKRRRQATRSERRGAALKKQLGDGAFQLCLFPLWSVRPPESPADLPLTLWKLQTALAVLDRQKQGKLYCICCDGAIAVDPPTVAGFLKAEDRDAELAVIAVCEACNRSVESAEDLTALVQKAIGGTAAPEEPRQ